MHNQNSVLPVQYAFRTHVLLINNRYTRAFLLLELLDSCVTLRFKIRKYEQITDKLTKTFELDTKYTRIQVSLNK